MEDICTYKIEVQGGVDEKDLNAMSPLQMTAVRVDTATMMFTVRADQSGLVGLMRHLHGRGLVFRSIARIDTDGSATRPNERHHERSKGECPKSL